MAGSKTLGLAATSMHPAQALVLDDLIEVLVEHDAVTHARLVNGCLANGRRVGAEMLARRGVPLDVEGAAGVGLDLVESYESTIFLRELQPTVEVARSCRV